MSKKNTNLNSPTLAALRAARGTRRRRSKKTAVGRVLGYLRCSSEEQRLSGLGLGAQELAIRQECERRGLELVAVFVDAGVSGSVPPDLRPGLSAAISALDAGEADILMVSKVDRLGRSFADLALLTPLAERAGWSIVALNCDFDMTTASGKAMANMMSLFAALERDLISERTVAALQVKKANGVKLGQPSKVTDEARARLGELRAQGLTWSQVAEQMNEAGIPSGGGEPKWHPASAQRLCPAA
jgi:DNA invertase Pin-like site-specific DNA recombinase